MRIITFLLSIMLLGGFPTARAVEPAAPEQPGTNEQAAAKQPPITKEQMLAAVAVLETNAASTAGTDASNVIIQFVKESDAVKVRLNSETLPWMNSGVLQQDEVVRRILLAAFIGGNAQAQLKTQKAVDDLYEGWTLAITAYRQIRGRKPEIVVSEIDELIAKLHQGELKLYAVEIQNKQPKP